MINVALQIVAYGLFSAACVLLIAVAVFEGEEVNFPRFTSVLTVILVWASITAQVCITCEVPL